jgi:hypothetical protein
MMKMEYPQKPEIVTFQGEEAKRVLEEYVRELEQNKPDELTEAQAKVMKRVARELIAVIEGETQTPPSKRQHSLFSAVARALRKHRAQLSTEESRLLIAGETEQSNDCRHQPLPLNQQFK